MIIEDDTSMIVLLHVLKSFFFGCGWSGCARGVLP